MSDVSDISAQSLSLAELANLETDDIATLTSRIPPAGTYIVKGKSAALAMSESDDPAKPNLFRVNFQTEVLAADLVKKDINPEQQVGRTISESYTLWPDSFLEGIGLLKGRYKNAGLPNEGKLGGVEGEAPGWLDSMVEAMFIVRVRHGTRKDGSEVAYYDWRAYEQADETAAAEE